MYVCDSLTCIDASLYSVSLKIEKLIFGHGKLHDEHMSIIA